MSYTISWLGAALTTLLALEIYVSLYQITLTRHSWFYQQRCIFATFSICIVAFSPRYFLMKTTNSLK